MPVAFQETIFSPGEWGLFHITEAEADLRELVPLSAEEARQIDLIQGEGRRREFLAARLLLHRMSGRPARAALFKDSTGKPHLADSHYHISISHTADFAAAIAHPNPCGIDVQRLVKKIERIADKFISPAERIQLKEADKLLQMHLIWSAKESMYKAFGRRQLDFKEHLYVDFHDFHPQQSRATAMLQKDEVRMLFDLAFRIYPNKVLVGCVERVT